LLRVLPGTVPGTRVPGTVVLKSGSGSQSRTTLEHPSINYQ